MALRRNSRESSAPRIVIVFPILMMLVFPFAVNMEIKNVNLVVVDNARSALSREQIEKCSESGYFKIVDIRDDPALTQDLMDKNTADAMRSIFLKGSSLLDVWYDVAGLFAIGVTAVTVAIAGYKKTT